jgi:hypothetical protein
MIGFFKSTNGSSLCIACSSGLSTLQIGTTSGLMCECGAGTETIDGGICQICLPGTYSVGGVGVSCTPCPPGTYGNTSQLETAQCSGLCESGFFCPLGSISSQQIRCPFDYSISLIGSDDQFDCTCIPGATGDDGGYCARCPIGYYGASGTANCIQCPPFTSTVSAGASNRTQCVCAAGYQLLNRECQVCQHDHYKDIVSNDLCLPCPSPTVVPRKGSYSSLFCVCPPGYEGENGGPCYETTEVTVYISLADSQESLTSSIIVHFVANFSRSMDTFPYFAVIISGTANAVTAVTSGSGSVWVIAVSGMRRAGTVTIEVDSSVALSRASPDAVVTYDNVNPSVTVVQAPAQVDPIGSLPIYFTATWSKPMTLISPTASTNVNLTSVPLATWPEVTLVMVGTEFGVITVRGDAPIGTFAVSVSIPAGIAHDALGNLNLASITTDNTITVDRMPPAATWISVDTFTDSVTGSTRTQRPRLALKILFAESVSWASFSLRPIRSPIVISGSAVSSRATNVTYSSPAPSNTGFYEVNVTLNGLLLYDGANMTLKLLGGTIIDQSGNVNTASSFMIFIDFKPPSVIIARVTSSPTKASAIRFSLRWSDLVTGLSPAGIVIHGTAGASSVTIQPVSPSGAYALVFIVSVMGMTHDGNVSISVLPASVIDIAGNTNLLSLASASIDYDITAPSFTLTSPQPNTTHNSPLPIMFTLTEEAAPSTLRLIFHRNDFADNTVVDPYAPHTFNLSDAFVGSGDHAFDMVCTAPLTTPNDAIISASTSIGEEFGVGVGLVSNVYYDIELVMEDIAGNIGSYRITTFLYDVTPPSAPRLFTPESYGTRGSPLQVQFLFAAVTSFVSIRFEDQSGTDQFSPHELLFNSSLFEPIRHTIFLPIHLSSCPFVTSVNTAPYYDYLYDGAVYTVTLLIKDLAGNEAFSSSQGFIYDSTSAPVPELTSPQAFSYISSPLAVSLTLPQQAEANSVLITFTRVSGSADTNSPHVLRASYTSAGPHLVTIDAPHVDLAPLGSEFTLTSGGAALVHGAIYLIRSEYKWIANGNIGFSINSPVTLDIVSPINTVLTSPATSSGWSTFITVTFTLPEDAASGTVKLTLSAPNDDVLSIVTFDESMETKGTWSTSLLYTTLQGNGVKSVIINRPLEHGSLFNVMFGFMDRASNPSPPCINTGIIIDLELPGIVDFVSPISNEVVGAIITVSFKTLSTAAPHAVGVTLVPTAQISSVDGATTPVSWTVIMDSSFGASGVKTVNLQSASLASSTGVAEVRSSNGWSSLTAFDEVASLSSGWIYTVTVSYLSLPGVLTSASTSGILVDWQPPSLPLLQCNRADKINLVCNITLFEGAMVGSVQLTLQPKSMDAGVTRVITFDSTAESARWLIVILELLALQGGTAVHSVTPLSSLVADATYILSLSYRDTAGNLVTSEESLFTFDTQPPLPAVFLSMNETSIFEPPFAVHFWLSEEARGESLQLQFLVSSLSPISDGHAPHSMTLLTDFLSEGEHIVWVNGPLLSATVNASMVISSNLLSGEVQQLVNGAVYYLTIIYDDLAGNSVSSTSGEFNYSSMIPCEPVDVAPLNGTVGSCISRTIHGGTCSFTCDSRFIIQPLDSQRTCSNGMWIGIVQTCEGRTCELITAPSKGTVGTCSAVNSGSSCSIGR